MTPIEPPSPPRKASWKRWVVAVACVAAIALAALFFNRVANDEPPEDALKISFKGYTNSPSGRRFALFTVTNMDTCKLVIWKAGAVAFQGTNWPVSVEVFHSLAGSNLDRGVPYTMISTVPTNDLRWRVTWIVHRSSLKQALVDITGKIPFVPDYNHGSPDSFYCTTDWLPE